MTNVISLNSLLGEEYEYCTIEPEEIAIECMEILEEISILEQNMVTIEAAKQIKSNRLKNGGTGPLPTNTKKDKDDYHSDIDKSIIVDFEETRITEKRSLLEHIKILLRKIGEWIEGLIHRIISSIRQDKMKINSSEFKSKLVSGIEANKIVKTYPFKGPPEGIVSDCLVDITKIVGNTAVWIISPSTPGINTLPFDSPKIMGINLTANTDDLYERIRNGLLGGKMKSISVKDAHITEETFNYFIQRAPAELEIVRNAWRRLEKKFGSYDADADRIVEIKRVVIQAHRCINAALSAIASLIWHMSALMYKISK
jgi:hypothetical protein